MSNLFDYGKDLAEVFTGAFANSMCAGLPEERAVQIAYSVTSIYATFNKPQPPIRIRLNPAPKQAEPPKQNEERDPKKPKGKGKDKDE